MHSLLLSWFSWVQVLALARKVTLGLPRLLVVEEFPNKALLFGSSLKLVNCKAKDCSIAYYIYYDYIRIIDVYANDAKYCAYIWVLTVACLSPMKLMTVYLYISSQQSSFALQRPPKHQPSFHVDKSVIGDTSASSKSKLIQHSFCPGASKKKPPAGLGISSWSCLSENFDVCLDGVSLFLT